MLPFVWPVLAVAAPCRQYLLLRCGFILQLNSSDLLAKLLIKILFIYVSVANRRNVRLIFKQDTCYLSELLYAEFKK